MDTNKSNSGNVSDFAGANITKIKSENGTGLKVQFGDFVKPVEPERSKFILLPQPLSGDVMK